jgi:hypothetical protein
MYRNTHARRIALSGYEREGTETVVTCPIQLLRNLVLFNHLAISKGVFYCFSVRSTMLNLGGKTARDASFK